ncbi:hypothetical protein J6590_107671 [Homalodisca vitripennis]|nr:hypothetical protein J6590_107671 [Homalodisca vitripennis]
MQGDRIRTLAKANSFESMKYTCPRSVAKARNLATDKDRPHDRLVEQFQIRRIIGSQLASQSAFTEHCNTSCPVCQDWLNIPAILLPFAVPLVFSSINTTSP